MADTGERACVGCGDTEALSHLESCSICQRPFCADCAHKAAFGRKFCSVECARAYYFSGEPDDDDDQDAESE